MVQKLFKTISITNKKGKIIIKRNKFINYKDTNEQSKKILSKNENEYINKKAIMFKIHKFNDSKKTKIIKNNKLVYNNNSSEDFSHHNTQNYSNKPIKKFIRNSSFRGVSKNGNKWQVLFMSNNKRYYLGNFNSEKIAAAIYDIFALKYRGNKAYTNYIYTRAQMEIIKEIKI